MNADKSTLEVIALLADRINLEMDRELTMTEAALRRGVSTSLMRKRVALVQAWREAFFVSGTSKELRTTMRRLRIAEDKLSLIS